MGAQLAAAVQAPLKYPSQCFCTKDYEGLEAKFAVSASRPSRGGPLAEAERHGGAMLT